MIIVDIYIFIYLYIYIYNDVRSLYWKNDVRSLTHDGSITLNEMGTQSWSLLSWADVGSVGFMVDVFVRWLLINPINANYDLW